MKKRAFTFSELLLVLSLFAITITSSLPSFSFLNSWRLTNEIEALFSICSYLQRKAMASNQIHILTFDSTSNSYSYLGPREKLTTHSLHNTIQFGFLLDTKGPPSHPTKLIKKPLTFSTNKNVARISFYPDGTLTPGTAYLTDKEKSSMQAITCCVGPVSYLRKYILHSGRWHVH